MNNNKTFGVIIILVLIGVILGFFVVQQQKGKLLQPVVEKAPVSQYVNPEDILRFPEIDASPEVRNHFFSLVASAAKDSPLEIGSGCSADPLAVRVLEGENLSVKNTSDSDQEFFLTLLEEPGPSYKIPARQTVEMAPSLFKKGTGAYGYNCESNLASPRGVIWVTTGGR